jgi:hypothetical protein
MRPTTIRLAVAALAVTMAATLAAFAGPHGGSVPAVWVPKHVRFIYQGFTTRYSCDGLRDEVTRLLSKMGPRDLKVREQPCSGSPDVPSPFPGVTVSMQVLVPASKAPPTKTAPVVPAHWRQVALMPGNASLEQHGNCELIEQFKETFVPLFSTRNIRYESDCVPYQESLGTRLSAQVLMPDRKAAAAAGGR